MMKLRLDSTRESRQKTDTERQQQQQQGQQQKKKQQNLQTVAISYQISLNDIICGHFVFIFAPCCSRFKPIYSGFSNVRRSTLISNNQINESNRLMSYCKLKLFFQLFPRVQFFSFHAHMWKWHVLVCVRVFFSLSTNLRFSIRQMDGKRGKTLKSFSWLLFVAPGITNQ